MISVILMGFVTVAAVFFLIETGKASKTAAAEIVMSKAWSSRFARQTLEEKKEEFLEGNAKYHTVPEKKAAKKVKEWDKQISAYQKTEEQYLSGKKFSLLDLIPLPGYQLLADMKLDGDSELLRKLTYRLCGAGAQPRDRGKEEFRDLRLLSAGLSDRVHLCGRPAGLLRGGGDHSGGKRDGRRRPANGSVLRGERLVRLYPL